MSDNTNTQQGAQAMSGEDFSLDFDDFSIADTAPVVKKPGAHRLVKASRIAGGEKTSYIHNTIPEEEERPDTNFTAEESDGGVATGVKSISKVKKPSLFDKSSLTDKEDSLHISKEYQFKSYVDGEDGVIKELIERSASLRKTHHDDPLTAARIINLDVAMKAPLGYFNKYAKAVSDGVSYCRPLMSDSGKAELIARANDNPTDMEVQNEAFLPAMRFINDYIGTTKYRGIEREIVSNLIINEMLGFDVLDPLWHDTRVTEIVCNGPFDIQVEIAGEMYKVPSLQFRDREHLERLLERLFRSVGKVLAQATPQTKGRLHDKSRIFATHHSISPDGPNFNIRRHPHGFWTPQSLIDRGAASEEIMTYLGNLIHKGASFIIAGGTSTGKSVVPEALVQTPSGAVEMGVIAVGDKIFDHTGKVCLVTNKFINKPRQVYAVKLDTGNTIFTDLEHNWLVSALDGESNSVVTTGEMLRRGVFADGAPRFSIPRLLNPVDFDNALDVDQLPVHPYRLGLFLGGDVSEVNDSELVEMAETFGVYAIENGRRVKCIPSMYKYATAQARKLLISGLIDSTGNIANTLDGWILEHDSRRLTSDFTQVASSLGYLVNSGTKATHRDTQGLYFTAFVATSDNLSQKPSLQEKAHKLHETSSDNRAHVVSIYPVKGQVREMQCITVDSEHSTYMVSEHFTTTHNTSMLNALTGFYPSHARILTLEDNLELKPNPKKFLAAAMETRPPSPDKPNDSGVTMRQLVWGAMQMRPEVMIIGEVTDSAAYDLCQALNTGHAGASTFHANSSQLAITRVASLVAQSGLTTIDGAFDLISAAFDFVINVRHFPQDGSRRIFSIDEVGTDVVVHDGKVVLKTHPIWKFDEQGIDENGNIEGMWTKVGDISRERSERRMFDSQKTLSWEQLKELSDLPANYDEV